MQTFNEPVTGRVAYRQRGRREPSVSMATDYELYGQGYPQGQCSSRRPVQLCGLASLLLNG